MLNGLTHWSTKKESAIRDIDNADRWLNSGEALNWVPQEISTAIYWAIEGWLNQCEYTPDFGNGWNSMYHQFRKFAPEKIHQESSYILSKVTFLEIELLGDPSGLETRPKEWTLDSWIIKANDILLKTRHFINNIEEDLLGRINISSKANTEVIPEWNSYYPTLSQATTEQKQFYEYWLTEFKKGNCLDIQGNLSYVFVYLYSIITNFIEDKQLSQLIKSFEKVKRGYGTYEIISDYIVSWTADAHLYLSDYDNAWKFINSRKFDIVDVYNFRAKCVDKSINGHDLITILSSDSGLTEFGKSHQKNIANLATIFLKDFSKKYGKNIVEYFCEKFDFSSLTEDDFFELKTFFPDEKKYNFWRNIYETDEKHKYPYKYGHYIFGGVPTTTPSINCYAIPYIISTAITNEFKRILRECENTIREEQNLPKVGEGWISETELFYEVCQEFPNENIIHHGRPAWLSPQHIDIFFPDRKIGIEYQGKQHLNPVEYFGGEKAFIKQQKFDRKKRLRCKRNNCKLFYVYEGYDFEVVRLKIREFMYEKGRIGGLPKKLKYLTHIQ